VQDLVIPSHVMDVIEEELGKLSFLDPHSSEFKCERRHFAYRC